MTVEDIRKVFTKMKDVGFDMKLKRFDLNEVGILLAEIDRLEKKLAHFWCGVVEKLEASDKATADLNDALCCVIENLQAEIIENDEYLDFSHKMRIAHQVQFVRAWQKYTESNSRIYPGEVEVYLFAERGVTAADLIKRMKRIFDTLKNAEVDVKIGDASLFDNVIAEADEWVKENERGK